MTQQLSELDENAVLALTEDGERELREPGTTLGAVQLEALVLIDGWSTVAQVAKRARGAPREAVRTGLSELVERNLVRIVSGPDSNYIDPGDFFTSKAGRADAPAGEQAKAEAEADAEFLRQNGYCVNMARRGAAERKRADGRNLTVLVIDDDPDIGALLHKYLKLEGLDTRMAANRDEIVDALRRPPRPDLILLDVDLPGLDGFHVLSRLREHPALSALPVIMLTGTATREVVLKGLLGGADGHITKPFKIHALVRAVKAVLGLKYDPREQDWDLSL